MIYEIKNDFIRLKVSSIGAEMKSLIKDGREYLWQGDPRYWRGTAPNLFPFIGRSYEGKYSYKGVEYEMGPHGFLKLQEFTKIDSAKNELVLEFASNTATFKIYPFKFRYTITYRISGTKLDIIHQVFNEGNEMMYFTMGGHPGFNVPLDDGLSFEDYYLEFSDTCYPMELELTKNLQMDGNAKNYKIEKDKIIRLDHHLFDFDSITLKNISKEVTLKSDKGNRKVKVGYPQMGYLGLWHKPQSEAPYLCIEPWCGLPTRELCEEISSITDFIRLESNEVYKNSWYIEIE